MIEKLLCTALGLFLSQIGCQPAGSPELTQCQREAIADTVEQTVTDWFEAFVELNAEAYARYIGEDLIVAGDGGYLSTDQGGPAWSGSFDSFHEATGTIEIENLEVLGPNAAVVNWRVDVRWILKSDRVAHHTGLATAVVARRDGQWKMIRQHESGVRPKTS